MDNIFRAIKKKALEISSIDAIKKEIDRLGNISYIIGNFEKSQLLNDQEFIKKTENSKNAMNIKLINSKIKERQEINEKLKILAYHLSLIKSTRLTKDYNAARRCMRQFTANDFTKVSAVLRDINKFKNDINKLDSAYEKLADSHPKSLEYKITFEFPYKKTINSLLEINKKQSQITAILGKGFVNSAKEIINNPDYRDFIKNNEF